MWKKEYAENAKKRRLEIKREEELGLREKKPYVYRPRPGRQYYRDNFLRSKYGITLVDYNTMFDNQEGCCAICGTHQSLLRRAMCVDHNHVTKKVRGLLCDHCNRAIGYAREDTNILLNMVKYIEETN